MSTVHVVTGAMFGSEGKGHVTAQLLSNEKLIHNDSPALNIRVAGPNAGHTVIDQNGVAFPLRTIPVGAAINPQATLYLSPGSEIELEVLKHEVDLLRSHGHAVNRLIISGEATVLEQKHKDTETALDIHAKLGSTGKGIGAARADRIMRSATRFIDHPEAMALAKEIGALVFSADDSLRFMSEWITSPDSHIVIEGTQGYGLGLHAGHYPTCTSSDARAIDFLAMAGISPWAKEITYLGIWLVARVYPIRVAGNSGPLKGETTWEELGLPIEKTTVTHKVRRVGEWDPKLIRDAAVANGANIFADESRLGRRDRAEILVALTMVDQKLPQVRGLEETIRLSDEDFSKFNALVEEVQKDAGVPVAMMTTGPDTAVVLW